MKAGAYIEQNYATLFRKAVTEVEVTDVFEGHLPRPDLAAFLADVMATYAPRTQAHEHAKALLQSTSPTRQAVQVLIDRLQAQLVNENQWQNLKAVSATPDELVVANYMILWGDERRRDLEGRPLQVQDGNRVFRFGTDRINRDGTVGEWFTPNTDFSSPIVAKGVMGLDWEHRRERLINRKTGEKVGPWDVELGIVNLKDAKMDDVGLWVTRVLDRHNKYVQALEPLIRVGVIGNSTEPFQDMVKKAPNGEILRWGLRKDTLTPTPMQGEMKTYNVVQAYAKAAQFAPEFVDSIQYGLTAAPDSDQEPEGNVDEQTLQALQSRAKAALIALSTL